MIGIMDENHLIIVKKYEILEPLFPKKDAIIGNCYEDCHNKYFHTFENK